MKRYIFFILLILGLLGIVDASYLTYEHYANIIPPCTINHFLPFFSDCGLVLRSAYAVLFGIPLAVLGLIHYVILTLAIGLAVIFNKKLWWFWLFFQTLAGAIFSLYLMYLQIFVIKNICIYCTLSAVNSFILFFLSYTWLEYERKSVTIYFISFIYQYFIKPLFFLIHPEIIHELMLSFGELIGKFSIKRKCINFLIHYKNPKLHQTIEGIEFPNPLGLAAGFDYTAQLTQILDSIGFGFHTVGTITNLSYEGNPNPMLGRLPKSKALMVNKGFKNLGAKTIVKKLSSLFFQIPLGISIGRSNSPTLIDQTQSVNDVIKAFKEFESSKVSNAYYELNISCPNLIHAEHISFYPPKNLKELLNEVLKLKIKKPVFVKMPIEKSNDEFIEMLQIIDKYAFIKGVIIGNLQKNRKDPSLDPDEVRLWKVGNFSGKPCFERSNELIKLTFQKYKKRFVIVGCGGVFSAEDAYKKIRLGASLIQLITGMIYQGPSLIPQINLELVELLKKDKFKNISEVIGIDSN